MTETLVVEKGRSSGNTFKPERSKNDATRSRLKVNENGSIVHHHHQQQHEQPSQNATQSAPNVGQVVTKAKKAAQSIWILVHAQNCTLGVDRCPHKGCKEAKKALLHIKTCPAKNGMSCPLGFDGCQQSRKLLGHYQRCREIRAKQAGRRDKGSHVCLVCSLVARHARNVLDGGKPSSYSSRKNPSLRNNKQVIASFTLASNNDVPVIGLEGRSNSLAEMPPPPPRGGSSQQQEQQLDKTYNSTTPPLSDHLMLFSEVATAAAESGTGKPIDTSTLGKSLDTSRSSFLTAASALQNLKQRSLHNDHNNGKMHAESPNRRLRAESYDAAALKRRAKHWGDSCSATNDPTLELELREGEKEKESPIEISVVRRNRSASLSLLASCATGECDTILEEQANHRHQATLEHEQVFPMEDA